MTVLFWRGRQPPRSDLNREIRRELMLLVLYPALLGARAASEKWRDEWAGWRGCRRRRRRQGRGRVDADIRDSRLTG